MFFIMILCALKSIQGVLKNILNIFTLWLHHLTVF